MRESEQAETYLRQAQELADIGSWHLDIPSGELLWSDACYRIFGIPIGEPMSYERFLEQVHPADRDAVAANWEQALAGGEYDIEHRIVVDGRVKWVRERAEFAFDEADTPTEGIGVVQEITEEKTRLKQLRGFRKAVEAAGHSIHITDPDGTITYVNPAFEETTGYTSAEVLGETPQLLKSEEHPPEFYGELWETITAGEIWDGEVINETKSGDQYVIAQTIAPVTDSDGQIEGFVAVNTDITDRKRSEEKLRRRSQALEEAPVGMLITDPGQADNPLIYANKAAEEITGYSKAELMGENARILQGEQTDPQKVQELRTAIDSGEQTTVEIRNYRKDGTEFWNEMAIAPVRDDAGTIQNWVGFQRDITERRQRTTQLGVMNRILRHNLRNDMNVINGRAKMLNEVIDADESESAETIIELSDQLIEMAEKAHGVTSLLQTPPTRAETDLEDRVRAVVSEIRAEHPAAEISVSTHGTTTATPATNIDSAIEELVTNAVVHTDQDTPEIAVELVERARAVEIEVRDNGPTIDESDRGLLLGEEPTQLKHGSGIGLWMVNIVTDRSGGSVSYAENSPRGNRIRLRLP